MKEKTESYTFRIPKSLRLKLEALAESENRSLANLIITILMGAVKD